MRHLSIPYLAVLFLLTVFNGDITHGCDERNPEFGKRDVKADLSGCGQKRSKTDPVIDSEYIVPTDCPYEVANSAHPFFARRKLMFLDFETTTIDPKEGARAISLGMMLVDDGREVYRWHAVFNPDMDSEPAALKAHGITREETINKPRFDQLAAEVAAQLVGIDTVITHNVPFDHGFMLAEFQRTHILHIVQQWNLEDFVKPASMVKMTNWDKASLAWQIQWVNVDPLLRSKRLCLVQRRLATSIWLCAENLKVLERDNLWDAGTKSFDVPFLTAPLNAAKTYKADTENALYTLYQKLSKLEPRNWQERGAIADGRFERVDISGKPEFSEAEKQLKAAFDKQVRAVSVIDRFKLLDLPNYNVYSWANMSKRERAFCDDKLKEILYRACNLLMVAKVIAETYPWPSMGNDYPFLSLDKWFDTLKVSRDKLEYGQDINRHTLDAMCDFYGVDRSARNAGHNSLVDTVLLVQVTAHLVGAEVWADDR